MVSYRIEKYNIKNMKIEYKNISSVIPYARNPRKNGHAVEKVAASIKEFGFQQPIVVDERMVVIVGHVRLKAAQQLGLEKVPITIASDLSPQQVKAYRIADNRVGQEAHWDDEYLSLELGELENDIDLSLTGLDQEEIDKLLSDVQDSSSEFPEIDETINCENTCPKCKYTW